MKTGVGIRRMPWFCLCCAVLFSGCSESQKVSPYDDPYHPLYRMNRVGWVPDKSGSPVSGKPGEHKPPHPVILHEPKTPEPEESDNWISRTVDLLFDRDDEPPEKKRRKPRRKPPPPPDKPEKNHKPLPEKPKYERKLPPQFPGRRSRA